MQQLRLNPSLARPNGMRLFLWLLVGVLAAGLPAAAQTPAATPPGQAPAADATDQLPVSLDRIREGLKRAERQSMLRTMEARADFVVLVEEQAHLDELMKKLDFKTGPAPAGGLYAYEQQRRLFNPVSRPLQQPYAAFSGGEFMTIAIQNILGRYIASKAVDALNSSERSRAQNEARREVERAVAEYCNNRSDAYLIRVCYSRLP